MNLKTHRLNRRCWFNTLIYVIIRSVSNFSVLKTIYLALYILYCR